MGCRQAWIQSSWEGDEAVMVDACNDRRGREGGDSLKTAHECVYLNNSYEHWSIDSKDQYNGEKLTLRISLTFQNIPYS